MLLGLDISTSMVGYTILDLDGNIVKIGHFDLTKIKKTIWDKVDFMKSKLEEINKKHNISRVIIEEPLSKFSKGKSSSHTISLLMRFNGIISYLIHNIMKIDAIYYSPSSARKICGLKMLSKAACRKQKIKWKPQKEQAFEQMNAQAPFVNSYRWPLKRTGKLKDFCYDEMDSYIVCRAGFLEMKHI